MSITYAQKQTSAQKKNATSAASVLDNSSQNESLQRKADMANEMVIQQIRFTEGFERKHCVKEGLSEESSTYASRGIPKNDVLTAEAFEVLKNYSAENSWLCIQNVPCRKWNSAYSFTKVQSTVWVSDGNAWHLGPTVVDDADKYQLCDYTDLVNASRSDKKLVKGFSNNDFPPLH